MTFVAKEHLARRESMPRTLFRFLWDLKLARILFVPAFAFSLLACLTPQVLLWNMGRAVGQAQSNSSWLFGSISSFLHISDLSWGVFLAFIAATLACKILSLVGMEIGGQWSTQLLHQRMIRALSRTRTTFFDENPSGRIINRVVGDYANIRMRGVAFLADAQYAIAELLCIALVIGTAHPWPAFFILPILWAYVNFQSHLAPMISHSRGIKSILQGELLHRESDLIYGHNAYSFYERDRYVLSAIVRVYRKVLDADILYARLSAWGYFWMGAASILFLFIVYLFLVVGLHTHALEAPTAAVVLSVLFTLEASLSWVAMTMTNLSSSATYIERTYEYIDLPPEDSEEGVITARGPVTAEIDGADIEFINYSMSYRPSLPRILSDLSMKIRAGERVGIVGRTGSGKSSWIQALLRMVHVQGGDIQIGGQSIFRWDLDDYRGRFGIVPQDPYLFAGTVRSNLTGQKDTSQDELFKSLFKALHLEFTLDTPVDEGGSNFSVGEKQLICILRAIAQKKSIIIMDEPTGVLNTRAENQIRQLIAKHLHGKTVVLVAHRLETLRDFDRVFHFDAGKLVQSGTPAEVLPKIT